MSKRMFAVAAMLIAAPALAEERMMDRGDRGIEIYGGAGVGNFSQDLGDVTDAGLAWGARVGFHPYRAIGGELAYQGANGNVNTIVTPGAVLQNQDIQEHTITANAKLGWPVRMGERELIPYGLIGLGYTRLNSEDALEAVGLGDDNAFTVPLGAGVGLDLTERFSVDGRFVYNFLSSVDNLPLVNDKADSWTATLNIGTVFGR